MKTRSLILFSAIFALTLFVSCQKEKEGDFAGIRPHDTTYDQAYLKVSGAVYATGDTVHVLPNMVLNMSVVGLPALPAGVAYQYMWNLGNGASALTTAGVEYKYQVGIYQVMVNVTNPLTGAVITLSEWINCSETLYYGDAVIVISASPTTGGYDYLFGFFSGTVFGFVNPDPVTGLYAPELVPFVTGTFCNWITPQPSAPNHVSINNKLYITKHIISANNTMQEFQFGQGDHWSYDPSSKHWIWTGTGAGKYRVYTYGGSIYNSSQSFVYVPGENGDSINAVYPPTVRDSIIHGTTAAYDSIRLFINYHEYANGNQPFFNYKKSGAWLLAPLHIIGGTNWGYYTLAINDFASDSYRIYFRFGPNLSAPSSYGIMSHSKFFYNDMLALQVNSLKSSGRQYSIVSIK